MSSSKVIVFGATGNVGSYVATTAQKNGALVTLAMRDTSKTIPTLSKEDEASGNYKRIQADLTKPETVTAAVKESGAKSAFIYLMQTSQDGMKSIIQTLKDAGITFVVFLSSYTIRGNPADIPPADLIPFIHARVELSLEEVYGSANYVTLRPGGFATNVLHWKKDLDQGHVRLYCPKAQFDYITPEDMGQVGGVILAGGKQVDGKKEVYLFGPNMTAQEDAVKTISKITSRGKFHTHTYLSDTNHTCVIALDTSDFLLMSN